MKISVLVIKLTFAGCIGFIIVEGFGYMINAWQYWIIVIPAIFAMDHYVDKWHLYHKNKGVSDEN